MKKIIALSAAAVVALSFAFVGCGSSSSTTTTAAETTAASKTVEGDVSGDAASITGKWTLTKMVDADGNEVSIEQYVKDTGVDASLLEGTMDIKDDGTLTEEMAGVKMEGIEYTFDGNTLSITYNGTTSDLEYKADADQILSPSSTGDGSYGVFTR